MANIFPITLIGDNLGKRQLYLNLIVNEAYKRQENFEIIKNQPEKSPIDRLFKIDLANKIRNVEYIIKNLKDDDMLYVSRALKATWLIELEYETIIDPQYLEVSVYPEMITTAITRLQHWIHLNLQDEGRCYQFYKHYYKKNSFDLAIKFLAKCSKEKINMEFSKIIYKINPNYFKIFCQKCSHVVKIFFELLPNNEELKSQYLSKEKEYFLAIRHLLKSDADMILDINEKYFNKDQLCRFSFSQTKYIMTHKKDRFWNKPELYATWLLNIQAVADSLDCEEAKNLVIQLSRAKYLTDFHWFGYKFLEPLIQRIKPEERAEFKKRIFVKKETGDQVENWPYDIPAPPIKEVSECVTIFDDLQHEANEYENLGKPKRKLMKKCARYTQNVEIECCDSSDYRSCIKIKTLLDKLFDEFRFASFGKTLYELRKRITAESSPQNREYMVLVLVSKSGGRSENIALLLKLLENHINESPNFRAAIVRSLVKRAFIWRLPDFSWKYLLDFGQGLGLDGKTPVIECHEGLHAVVLRSLLLTGRCEFKIFNAFLDNFTTFIEYPLNKIEKDRIKKILPEILLFTLKENPQENIANAVSYINKLIDTLTRYEINVGAYPGLIDVVELYSKKDVSGMNCILNRLFAAKIARKQLFKYNYQELEKSNALYINALKHDISVLDPEQYTKYYQSQDKPKPDNFLNKLSLYFSEDNGLASIFLDYLKKHESDRHLGRPLAYLLGSGLENFLIEIESLSDTNSKLLAATIRANAHLVRPAFNIGSFGWKQSGVKLLANRVLKCRFVELNDTINNLLKCKRTSKLAFLLSKRTHNKNQIFIQFATSRPIAALKSGLKLFNFQNDEMIPIVWNTIKPIIQNLDISTSTRFYLVQRLGNIDKIPLNIKPDYSTVIYSLFKPVNFFKAMVPLCHVEMLLPEVNEQFIENLLEQFLNKDFVLDKLSTGESVKCTCLYIRILIKYLFLCKNEDIQELRFLKFGEPFFAKMEEVYKCPEKETLFFNFMDEVIKTFKYNKVFLNTEFVSCMPVMKKVIVWMRKILPIHVHFQTFALVHLAMIFYKSVQLALKQEPTIFSDDKRKRTDGVKIVGILFGKYVAKEVKTLTSEYFDSIIELYHKSLITYLDNANYYYISSDWLSSIIKGILEESTGSEYRISVYLLTEKCHSLNEHDAKDIQKYLNESKTAKDQWFAY